MDWSAVSNTQAVACSERPCITTKWTVAISHVSDSGQFALKFAPFRHVVSALTMPTLLVASVF